MKILVYGINYFPELTGIGKYSGEMCEWLAARAHQVDVITAMPYYPNWEVLVPYKGKTWHKEEVNGVNVYRTPLYVPKNVNGKTRILHDFSFLASSVPFWTKAFFETYDIVFSVYPPLPIGLFPVMYKYLRRKPMFFHVKDLQVDAAKQLNIISNKTLLSILEKMEKFFLKNATLVTTLTPEMRKRIIRKGIDADHVKLFPDWVDTSFMRPMYEERPVLKEKYGFQAWQHVVLYAGNIGEKQGLDGVIDVATKLQSQGRNDIQFMIVGEGAAKEKLVQTAKDRRLSNVKFSTLVPSRELPALLNMADLHLVLQKKGATDLVMPSKLLGILPCGGIPLVAAEKGSGLRDLIETHNIGITTEPEDIDALLQSILRFFDEPDYTLSRNARQYAVHHLTKDVILESFESLMYQVVDKHRATVLASAEYS